MANKKIKHIVAKLLGATTEETLDIYDESALHATDIVDNLTSTDATKVLSAKQGKALNDSKVSSITASGTTVTYKNAAGTTLGTFTTQDSNTWNLANNLTTTASNYALDARQGKVLNDKLAVSTVGLTKQQTSITLNTSSASRYGNIICIYARFSTSSQIGAYGNLINFGTNARVGGLYPIFSDALKPVDDQAIYFDSGNSNLRTAATLPVGTYRIYAVVMV